VASKAGCPFLVTTSHAEPCSIEGNQDRHWDAQQCLSAVYERFIEGSDAADPCVALGSARNLVIGMPSPSTPPP
jgi:hypothetical protein